MYILIVIFVLILINGFFAASEMALVSVKPADLHRLKTENKKNALILEKVTKDSTKYLSTIQVAITFAGFLSSAFAGSQLSGGLVNLLAKISINIPDSVAVILITVVLAFFTLVLGELVPKRIALNNATKFALLSAPIINVFMIMFKPFVWLLTISTRGVLRILGIKAKDNSNEVTEKEIKEMIVYGHISGLYPTEETKMMQRLFKFDDLTCDMIMTPIKNVIGFNLKKPNIGDIIESRYSRIPVFNGGKNNIAGVLFIKDLLMELKDKNIEDIDIESIIREPFIIQEKMMINDLFTEMRASTKHLAFILNDGGETEGIVTLEDIVEEIVGSIYDEHDLVSDEDEKDSEFTYILDGDNNIEDVNGKLGIVIDIDSLNYKTLHEFLMSRLDELPKEGEQPIVKIDCGYIKILNTEDNIIDQVELVLDEEKLV